MNRFLPLGLLFPTLAAAVPVETAHQGRLLGPAGDPIDGVHDLVVRLWSADSGGSPLWSESFDAVPVANGYYAVRLGGVSPLEATLLANDPWVSVAVDGGPDLDPRGRLGAAPFAVVARNLRGGTVDATSITATTVNSGEYRVNNTVVIDNTGKLAAAALPANAIGGSCYVRWGSQSCASGFTPVVTGYAGGFESYSSGGALYGNVQCVSGAASVLASYGAAYNTRMMRGDADANGMSAVTSQCAVCCTGGCYTALGTNSCASGWTRTVDGRIGGVEAYQGAQIYGETLCIGTDVSARYTWASGYDTRLMRHRDATTSGDSGGMQSVTNTCATCCR